MKPGDARGGLPTPAQQGVIRLAFLAGVLLFGLVIWWLSRTGGAPLRRDAGSPSSGELLRTLRLLAPALSVAAVAAAAFMRAVIARTAEPAKVWQLRLVAWAVGEVAALVGGVYWLLSGDSSRYVIGLIAMLATFVVVPLRAR